MHSVSAFRSLRLISCFVGNTSLKANVGDKPFVRTNLNLHEDASVVTKAALNDSDVISTEKRWTTIASRNICRLMSVVMKAL